MKGGGSAGTIGRWLLLLATPLLWATHFAVVYAASSLEITIRGSAGVPTRAFVLGATGVALAAIGEIDADEYHARQEVLRNSANQIRR